MFFYWPMEKGYCWNVKQKSGKKNSIVFEISLILMSLFYWESDFACVQYKVILCIVLSMACLMFRFKQNLFRLIWRIFFFNKYQCDLVWHPCSPLLSTPVHTLVVTWHKSPKNFAGLAITPQNTSKSSGLALLRNKESVFNEAFLLGAVKHRTKFNQDPWQLNVQAVQQQSRIKNKSLKMSICMTFKTLNINEGLKHCLEAIHEVL